MYTFTYFYVSPSLGQRLLLWLLHLELVFEVVNFNFFFSCFMRYSSNCENVPNRTRSTGKGRGELVCLADPVIIRREADNPVGQWSVSCFYNKAVKPALLFLQKILFLIVTNIAWFSTKCVAPRNCLATQSVDKHWFKPYKTEPIPFSTRNWAWHIKGGTRAEGVWKQGAEKYIWV